MGLLATIALVLVMIYLAAIVLAIRDRLNPPPEYAPRAPRIVRHPHIRTIRWFILPIWLPLAAFGLTMYAIVYLPVFAWRGIWSLICSRPIFGHPEGSRK